MVAQRAPSVLLLDDEQFLLLLYKKAFETAGYEVSTFTEADDALAALRAGFSPSLILFDITMPGMGGYAFLETLRREKLSRGAPAVALTNEAQEGEKARTTELGADAHLIKADYTPHELVAEVEKILSAGV